jgi:sugar phosphate isomerase/epimerase
MYLMMCIRGEPEQLPYLAKIHELGVGLELQSYGIVGIRSETDWQTRLLNHIAVCKIFKGSIAVHGPFIGIEYDHLDHLMIDVVKHRLDMTFSVANKLNAKRVILHSGYKMENDLFSLQAAWLTKSVDFWRKEILRWDDNGIQIVLENTIERSPDLLIQLIDGVNNPSLGICMDIGHQHLVSESEPAEWVKKMNKRLLHIHLHDNDRSGDKHWAIGRGTINFEPFYESLEIYAPDSTISLEIDDSMEVMLSNIQHIANRFKSE